MNKTLSALIVATVVAGTCGYAVAQRRGGGQSPVTKFINDLQQATPRAKLTDVQNTNLQSDVATLKAAQQAKRQGQSVDQDKLQAAISDLTQTVDSGAFQEDDQKQLDQDLAAIPPPQQ